MSKFKNYNFDNKQSKLKNIPKPEVSELKIQNNHTSLNYFYRNLILIICIIVSVFFIQKEINYLKTDVHWGDEVLNMLIVKNIVATGLPVYGTYTNTTTSPLNFNDALTVSYWEYAVELYLRTPVFLISKLIDFKWEYYSSLFYLYFIFILLVIYYLKNKELNFETKLPFTTIAFFILMFSVSKFVSSQFHYVRYYPFSIMIIPVILFVTNMIFVYSNLCSWKKYLLILAFAFIPGLFHLVNLSYLFFWFCFLFFYSIYNFIKNNRKLTIKEIITNNYKFVLSGIIIILSGFIFYFFLPILTKHFSFIAYLFNYYIPAIKSRLNFSSENIKVISEFFSFYFNNSFMTFNLIFIALIIFSIFYIKLFNKIESTIFYTSFGFLLFCLFVFSIIGGQEIITNSYSYMMFMFPVILILISLMLTLLFRKINSIIPNFFLKEIILFFVIAFVFISINYKKFEDNENRSDGTKQELLQLIEVNKTFKNLIFVTSKNALYFYAYFPDNKAYLLRNFPDNLQKNKITDDFYMSNSGYAKNICGEIYIGKTEAFCRMLSENINKLIYFYRTIPQCFSLEFFEKIKKIEIGNPVSAKYLNYVLCSKEYSEKTSDALKLSTEDGLLDEEYVALGVYLFNQSLFNDCKKAFLKALAVNPYNTHALVNLGVCYTKSSSWNDAIKAFKRALSIDPKLEIAQKNLQYSIENSKLAKNKNLNSGNR